MGHVIITPSSAVFWPWIAIEQQQHSHVAAFHVHKFLPHIIAQSCRVWSCWVRTGRLEGGWISSPLYPGGMFSFPSCRVHKSDPSKASPPRAVKYNPPSSWERQEGSWQRCGGGWSILPCVQLQTGPAGKGLCSCLGLKSLPGVEICWFSPVARNCTASLFRI